METFGFNMLNKVIYGDAVKLIKKVKPSSVDLLFCDFPFRFNLNKVKILSKEFFRVMKDSANLVLINNPANFFKIIPFFQNFIFRNEIVLIRPYKFIPFNKKLFYFKHNCIIWLTKTKDYYFKDLGLTDVFDHIHYKVKGKHVGSLPEELVKTIIEVLSKEGDFVLDVFAGYGTVKKVCKELKRNYLGFEIVKGRVK